MKKLLLLFTTLLAFSTGLQAQDSWQTATLLNSGETVVGNYFIANWFKIIVPEEGQIDITIFSPDAMEFIKTVFWGVYDGHLYDRDLMNCANNWVFYNAKVGPGVYYISINEVDVAEHYPNPGRCEVSYTFTPCPQGADPEPNNDYEHAALLESGASQGRLGYRSSEGNYDIVDWYRIEVPEEGKISINATGYDDLTFKDCIIYGFKDGDITHRGYFSGVDSPTATYQANNVGKGTYYFKINRSGGVGGYDLTYTYTPCPQDNDPEPNNDYEHASPLYSGNTVQGRLGYYSSDEVNDLEDWYKIDVTEEGQIDITVAGDGFVFQDCEFFGFKDSGIYIRGKFSYGNPSSYQANNAGIGTYYIKIKRYSGVGGYTLTYTFTPCPQAADPEPNDDYQHASLLENGQPAEGRLFYRTSDDFTDQEDWYRIEVPEEGQVQITVTSDVFTFQDCEVFGLRDSGIYTRGKFSYGNPSSYQANNVGIGTYYIKIRHYSGVGGYTLTYTFTPCPQAADPEPNDDYEHASLLESGQPAEGRLGYRTSNDFTDVEDWYRIDVPEEGQVQITVTGDGFVFQDCEFFGFKDSGIYTRGKFSYGNPSSYQANNVGIGTYYIKIRRYSGIGGYTLTYTFTPCPQSFDPEPNDDYQHACRLLNGVTAEGRLGYRASYDFTDTEDWYRITVPKQGHIEFAINGYDNLKFRDCAIYTLNGTTLTKTASFSGNYSNAVTYQADDVAKGTYYIKIGRDSGVGGYTIRYDGPISDIPGDVDGDGNVSIGDVSDLIDFLLRGDASSTLANADVDGDGHVTIGDVSDLIDMLLRGVH